MLIKIHTNDNNLAFVEGNARIYFIPSLSLFRNLLQQICNPKYNCTFNTLKRDKNLRFKFPHPTYRNIFLEYLFKRLSIHSRVFIFIFCCSLFGVFLLFFFNSSMHTSRRINIFPGKNFQETMRRLRINELITQR